jgi:UDP-N-acetyl-2-amino-2-deoxyglucuronate dehydrogenase
MAKELEFSEGFTELHTLTYQSILSGNGYGLDDALPSITIAHQIRNSEPVGLKGDFHPLFMNRKKK